MRKNMLHRLRGACGVGRVVTTKLAPPNGVASSRRANSPLFSKSGMINHTAQRMIYRG